MALKNFKHLTSIAHHERKSAPVIFFIHSGSRTSYKLRAVRSWLSLGYTVVSINHREVPKNKFSEQIGDCFLALKWVTNNIGKYGGNENRIAITGISVGAYMAAILVTEIKWQKIIQYRYSESKVLDSDEWFLQRRIAGELPDSDHSRLFKDNQGSSKKGRISH